ncbi:MAG TPA: hypothetical protein VMV49_07460 [Candidatus Deferrimicrobium sp.]|nr:hypothetical protein [Candidatus Deferrimicrobium sp.]
MRFLTDTKESYCENNGSKKIGVFEEIFAKKFSIDLTSEYPIINASNSEVRVLRNILGKFKREGNDELKFASMTSAPFILSPFKKILFLE